ncbi:MAG: hypothetical protein CSA75_03705, partial [Sorangium cellulosum]
MGIWHLDYMMDVGEIVSYWVLCFVSIFAVLNPFRMSTTVALVCDGWTSKQIAFVSRRVLMIVGAILFTGAWIGNHIIIRSQINMGGFRIASGLMLLAVVIPRMVKNRPFTDHVIKYM